jgi:hypothetical protein
LVYTTTFFRTGPHRSPKLAIPAIIPHRTPSHGDD